MLDLKLFKMLELKSQKITHCAVVRQLERCDTDDTMSIDTNLTTNDEIIIDPRKIKSQISTLSAASIPGTNQQFIA